MYDTYTGLNIIPFLFCMSLLVSCHVKICRAMSSQIMFTIVVMVIVGLKTHNHFPVFLNSTLNACDQVLLYVGMILLC